MKIQCIRSLDSTSVSQIGLQVPLKVVVFSGCGDDASGTHNGTSTGQLGYLGGHLTTTTTSVDNVGSLGVYCCIFHTLTNKIKLLGQMLNYILTTGAGQQMLREYCNITQIEAVGASDKHAVKLSEATQKEIDELKAFTESDLKRAHMAESAQKAVEGELKR
ncbi:hypothetical protein Tco_0705693 [Tanacetum coccineum]|uniref:Uncharacterized protein n=1 Tax=Tanacetum coccineum TaxID=301880 RepID=A0ABQ4Y7E5_9ASTR